MEVAVTGAFSFTGSFVARELLRRGHSVRTLTSHPSPPGDWARGIPAHPFSFDAPDRLSASLRGAHVLVNTYWTRLERQGVGFDDAVENTRLLMTAAKKAGVRRVVHVSVANPSADSPFPYFRAKAAAEEAVWASGLSHAIVRPTWVYGESDVLLNNVAWLLRHAPVMLMAGSGRYRVQPVYAGDVATLVADLVESKKETVIDAAGPDVFEYRELVRVMKRALGKRRLVVPAPPSVALLLGKMAGLALRDVVLTEAELGVLQASLMTSDKPPLGTTRLEDWLRANRAVVGRRWASDLDRHFRNIDLEPFKRDSA